jgi:hypothetical protein
LNKHSSFLQAAAASVAKNTYLKTLTLAELKQVLKFWLPSFAETSFQFQSFYPQLKWAQGYTVNHGRNLDLGGIS